MGNYRMWIGADENGAPLIGARACEDYDAVVTEQVYPSQLIHRVVARDADGRLVITTPTDADQRNLETVAGFPRANGALSAR